MYWPSNMVKINPLLKNTTPKKEPTLAVHHLASIHFGLYYALAILDTLHSLAGFWIFNTYRGWNSLQAGPQTLLQRRRRGGRLPWTVHVWSCFMGTTAAWSVFGNRSQWIGIEGKQLQENPIFHGKNPCFPVVPYQSSDNREMPFDRTFHGLRQ